MPGLDRTGIPVCSYRGHIALFAWKSSTFLGTMNNSCAMPMQHSPRHCWYRPSYWYKRVHCSGMSWCRQSLLCGTCSALSCMCSRSHTSELEKNKLFKTSRIKEVNDEDVYSFLHSLTSIAVPFRPKRHL